MSAKLLATAGLALAGGTLALKRAFTPSKRDLRGRVVLVTGGGGGVGRATAITFARRGARVLLWDVNRAALDGSRAAVLAEVPGAQVETAVVNLRSRDAVYIAAEAAQLLCWGGEKAEPVFCVCNNAGMVSGANLLDLEDEHIVATMEVNTLAHFWTTRAFLPTMLTRNEGHLVTVSSVAGLMGAAKLTDYCASKFATVGFHEALHAELRAMGEKASGVRASLVCPGHIKTPLFEGFAQPLVPSLTPEEVAEGIVSAVEGSHIMTVLPRGGGLAVLLPKAVLPARVMDVFAHRSKIDHAMAGVNLTHAREAIALMEKSREGEEMRRLQAAPSHSRL